MKIRLVTVTWFVAAVSLFAAMGLIGTALGGLTSLAAWELTAVGSVLLGGVAAFLSSRKRRFVFDVDTTRAGAGMDRGRSGVSVWRLLPGLSVLASLLPGIFAVALSVRMQISYHGFYHTAYILQVIHEQLPLENVTLPGTPVNVYWPYHALLAVLVDMSNLAPPLAAFLFNLVLLAGTLMCVEALFRELSPLNPGQGFPPGTPAILGLFGGNLFGVLHMAVITGILGLHRRNPLNPLPLTGDIRLTSLFEKYLNFNGFPLGLLVFVYLLVLGVRFLRKDAGVGLPLIGLLALLVVPSLHATTGIMIVGVLPAALLCTALAVRFAPGTTGGGAGTGPSPQDHISSRPMKGDCKQLKRDHGPAGRRRWSRMLWGGFTLAAAAVLGVLVVDFLAGVSSALPEKAKIEIVSAYDIKSIISFCYPVLPLFIPGWLLAFRTKEKGGIFLGFVAAGGLALSCLFELPDRNEYKFTLLSSVAMNIVAFSYLNHLLVSARGSASSPQGRKRSLAGIVSIAALVLIGFNLVFVGVNRFHHRWYGDPTYRYSGRAVVAGADVTVVPGDDIQYRDLYVWARENTPCNAVLVVPMKYRGAIVNRDQMALYFLSERLPFVVFGGLFNVEMPEYSRRQSLLSTIYSRNADAAEKTEALEAIRATLPGRPVFVVYHRYYEQRLSLSSLGMTSVYRDEVATLYGFEEQP